MKTTKFYFMIVVLALMANLVKAQKTLPYYTGFDNLSEKSGWKTYSLGVTGTYGPWAIGGDLHHDYSNVGPVVDWAVSPGLIFTAAGKISFKTQLYYMGYLDTSNYIGIWYCSGNQDPSSGSFTEIVNLTTRAAYKDSWLDTSINLPNSIETGYIGFKYKTWSGWFTVRFDSITVSTISNISETATANDILIYPNPIKTYGIIEVNPMFLKNGMELIICNLYGKTIRQIYSVNNTITFERNGISGGMYFYKLVSNNHILRTGKMLFE